MVYWADMQLSRTWVAANAGDNGHLMGKAVHPFICASWQERRKLDFSLMLHTKAKGYFKASA